MQKFTIIVMIQSVELVHAGKLSHMPAPWLLKDT